MLDWLLRKLGFVSIIPTYVTISTAGGPPIRMIHVARVRLPDGTETAVKMGEKIPAGTHILGIEWREEEASNGS